MSDNGLTIPAHPPPQPTLSITTQNSAKKCKVDSTKEEATVGDATEEGNNPNNLEEDFALVHNTDEDEQLQEQPTEQDFPTNMFDDEEGDDLLMVLGEQLQEGFEEELDQVFPEVIEDQLQMNQESEEDDEEEEEEEGGGGGEEEEDRESFKYIFSKFAEDWASNEVNHHVSQQASASFWNVTRKWMFQLTASFDKDKKKRFPKYENTRRNLVNKYVPPVSLDVGFLHKETKELTVVSNTSKTPIQNFPPSEYEKAFEIANIKVNIDTSCLNLNSIFFLSRHYLICV